MDVFSIAQAKAVQVGNDAGWILEFYSVEADGKIGKLARALKSSDYYASIEAYLQDDLRGGSYAITVQGLTDDAYQDISQANRKRLLLAKLYLFWHDAMSGPAMLAR